MCDVHHGRSGRSPQVFFDRDGSISGGAVRTYLLEKSRVVAQGKGERNYHIFYQVTVTLLYQAAATLSNNCRGCYS